MIKKFNNNKGSGLITTRSIQEGTLIHKYTGNVCELQNIPADLDKYYLQFGQNLFVGPKNSEEINDFYFINHSCNPNSWLFVYKEPFLIAKRDINSGEELTFDYSLSSFYDPWEMECLCGEINCRIHIGSIDRYHNDFIENNKKYLPNYIRNFYRL